MPFVTSPLSSTGGLIGVGSGQVVGSLPGGDAPVLGGYQGLYSSAAVPYGVSAGPYSVPSGPLATDVAQGGVACKFVFDEKSTALHVCITHTRADQMKNLLHVRITLLIRMLSFQ